MAEAQGPQQPDDAVRRRRLVVASIAAAVLLLVAVLIVVSQSSDDKVVLGATSTTAEPTTVLETTTSAAAVETTLPPTSAETTVPETTMAPTTTAPATVTEGFVPACAESAATNPPASLNETAFDTFGPLPQNPNLVVTLPHGVTPDNPEQQPTTVSPLRIPGGVLLDVGASTYAPFEGAVLAAVNADGSKRWVSCLDRSVLGVYAAPASSNPTVALVGVRSESATTELAIDWTFIGLADGTQRESLSIHEFPVATGDSKLLFAPPLDAPVNVDTDTLLLVDLNAITATPLAMPDSLAGTELWQAQFGFDDNGDPVLLAGPGQASAVYLANAWSTDPSDLAEAFGITVRFVDVGLAGFDATGAEVWSQPDLRSRMSEGFDLAQSGDVAVAAVCLSEFDPSVSGCTDLGIVGLNLADGTELWRITGNRTVGVLGGDYAIVSDEPVAGAAGTLEPTGWTMYDIHDGTPVDGQHWSDPFLFSTACCGEGDFVFVQRFGGVVVAVNEVKVSVWYPAGSGLATSAVGIP